MNANVTVVITSSNRHDLLEKTLDSFFACNTYNGIRHILVYEDSYTYPEFIEKSGKYPMDDISIMHTRPRLGHLLGIDVAYKYVDTEYIFHCEDDWEFYGKGFIEASLPILKARPDLLQVHLRQLDDVFPMGDLDYSFDPSGEFAVVSEGRMRQYKWYGFSLNPGLRRLADYQKLGSYSSQLLTPRYSGQHFENYIGVLYNEMGYKTAVSLGNEGRGFVRHLGEKRHIF
ncbi:hypothetical protein LJB81_02710 [Desulfovibrio sp. OttesenSCG-928-M14]|nr:hypothetical protein [Desulfovibrio sp. OttesenSCG-928-M14]